LRETFHQQILHLLQGEIGFNAAGRAEEAHLVSSTLLSCETGTQGPTPSGCLEVILTDHGGLT
jgi:hypothetical protein